MSSHAMQLRNCVARNLTATASNVVPTALDGELQGQLKRDSHSSTYIVLAARNNYDGGGAIY